MSRFYKCNTCGKIVEILNEQMNCPTKCCGEPMSEIVANSEESASLEKHVPVVEEKDGIISVKVGSVAHPMLPEHYIEWIYLLTDQGVQRKKLKPGQMPEVEFRIADNEIVLEVYANCNLHGLWKAKAEE